MIDKATKEERDRIRAWGRENGYHVGQMGIIAKEVVDAHYAAHGGTAVGAGGKACQTSLTNTTALLRPSTGCAESSGTRGVHTTARRKQGEYVQGMVCIRCRAQRSVRVDARNGDRLGSGGFDYQAASGYLLKGGGPLTAEERSELRLAEIQGHLRRTLRRRAG